MLGFGSFLTESLVTKQLKHLEHAEDHHINVGAAGFEHAAKTLSEVDKALRGKKSQAQISVKYDGSPSIVFGHHPENGKFFVASKSAFNVNPKINYTHDDVEKNHGHAPGLVEKMKAALDHLPKVAPKKGVYQGDLMYTRGDIEDKGGKFHFKPNTIKYSTDKNSNEGKKIGKAELGVVVHTQYHGKNIQDMEAKFGPGIKNFKKHSDVHVIDPTANVDETKYSGHDRQAFQTELKNAQKLHKDHDYSHIDNHREHLKTYINKTVAQGTSPTVEGLRSHIEERHNKKIDSLKSEKGKQKAKTEKDSALSDFDSKSVKFRKTLEIHKHLQNAKNHLVKALDANQHFEHSIADKPTGPEGHVAVINNMPTKLVNRAEFSRANLLARPR